LFVKTKSKTKNAVFFKSKTYLKQARKLYVRVILMGLQLGLLLAYDFILG